MLELDVCVYALLDLLRNPPHPLPQDPHARALVKPALAPPNLAGVPEVQSCALGESDAVESGLDIAFDAVAERDESLAGQSLILGRHVWGEAK